MTKRDQLEHIVELTRESEQQRFDLIQVQAHGGSITAHQAVLSAIEAELEFAVETLLWEIEPI
jgi:hypothetical protein